MNASFEKYLLRVTQAIACHEKEIIQSLWSGYGKISRYELAGSEMATVVVKNINLTDIGGHPRGWNTDTSHRRKVKSYAVETKWYERWSEHCHAQCRVPKFIGSYAEGENQWIILEDLETDFPEVGGYIEMTQIKVCLSWLANFHAQFLGKEPNDLWEIGTYWHLATRPDEFKKIVNQDLKAKAHLIDERLNACHFKTLVHGDAKLANFCFSKDRNSVAAVDFQYVGGGCGMKDVAYFLGSCLSSEDCEANEVELLNFYFKKFRAAAGNMKEGDAVALEIEWRQMYPIACADFTRFLMGWMPSHHKVHGYNMSRLNQVLAALK